MTMKQHAPFRLSFLQSWGWFFQILLGLPLLPLMPRVATILTGYLGGQLAFMPELLLLGGAVCLFARLPAERVKSGGGILVLLAAAELAFMEMGAEFPVEKMHYLFYSLLACTVYIAQNPARPRGFRLLKTLVLTCLAGQIDETLQGFIACRYCALPDALSNMTGGILGVGAAAVAFIPGRDPRPETKSGS